MSGERPHITFATIFWPVALLVAIFIVVYKATDNVRKNKLNVRAELEKELADAKAEVGGLLGPKK